MQERSAHDRRSVRVKVSEKGLKIVQHISDLYDRHVATLTEGALLEDELDAVNKTLRSMERFWAHNLAYGPRPSEETQSSAA